MSQEDEEYGRPISFIAFAVAIGVYIIIEHFVIPAFTSNSSKQIIIVEFFASLGVYEGLFFSMYWLYDSYFFRLFHKHLDLNGNWYQILTINGTQPKIIDLRQGPCNITGSPRNLVISGENKKGDVFETQSSTWASEATAIRNNQLIVLYQSEGSNRKDNVQRRGTMVFHLKGTPPTKLNGQWADVSPAVNRGTIEIYRNEQDYQKRLQALKNLIS